MPTLSMLLKLYFPLKDNTACRAFLQGLGLHAQLRWPLICNSVKTKEFSLETKNVFIKTTQGKLDSHGNKS